MKRILGIVGSPRKNGNTHRLVSAVLEGARTEGAHTQIVFLNDLVIRECDGCHACWAGKPCPRNDDMNGLYPEIASSDVLVFGTPVYWYGPTGIMKTFIDRFVYFNCPENRRKIGHASAVVVAPFEERRYAAADLLVRFFEKSLGYLGIGLAAKVLVPGVTKRGEVSKRKSRMDACRRLGARIAKAGGNPQAKGERR